MLLFFLFFALGTIVVGSAVMKDLPKWTIVAGNPTIVKRRENVD